MVNATKAKTGKRNAATKSTQPKNLEGAATPNRKAEANVPAKRETKIGKVVNLLKRKEGATLDEIIEATGWQPHTTRAAMTGLKKKGHTIERSKRGDASCYQITASR